MSLGGLLTVIFIQLGIVLGPLALGVVGLISGGAACLASLGAWFLLGIPLSYSAVDIWSTWLGALRVRAGTRSLMAGFTMRSRRDQRLATTND